MLLITASSGSPCWFYTVLPHPSSGIPQSSSSKYVLVLEPHFVRPLISFLSPLEYPLQTLPESCGSLLPAVVSTEIPSDASGKEPACQCRRHRSQGFDPWVGKIPWRRKWQSIPAFLPRESHGLRSLVGYRPWGCKELDTTEAT